MAKYRGSLRAQSYTKMRWSRVGGFTSFAKVVYERCLMNFCFLIGPTKTCETLWQLTQKSTRTFCRSETLKGSTCTAQIST